MTSLIDNKDIIFLLNTLGQAYNSISELNDLCQIEYDRYDKQFIGFTEKITN